MLGAIFLFVAFTPIPTGEIQLFTTLQLLQAMFAVVVRRKQTMPVIPSNYRLVSGQRASLETVPPPRDRLSLGGQSELLSWWFVPDHIHSTSSSILLSRYNRLALAVTNRGRIGTLIKTTFAWVFVCFHSLLLAFLWKLLARSYILL